MKKLFLVFIMLIIGLLAQAQSISVKSFRALPMDMTASSLEGKRIDQNGQVAALIKVMTTQTGFVFEGGTLGIVDSQQRIGEIWVWVPRASRKITILHQQLGGLRDYRYPIEIEAERTYEMVLTTDEIEINIKKKVTQQYLIFELEPKNAILEVNDQLWSVDTDGTALQFVDFGKYTYRVRAANYETDAGIVTVDDSDPEKPVTVKVKLKPNFAEVTLKVDADAEIWVNNEKKGTRTWTGPLGKGTYKIECKQASHETTMISQEISADMNGQTVTLPAPIPIYGSLNLESTPNGATIYMDGKEIGKTPRFLNEVLIGAHELRLSKDGYADYTETVMITQGERKQVKAMLSSGKEIQFTCNVPNAQLEIDGQRVGTAAGAYQLTYGSHSLRATAADYQDYTTTLNVTESSRSHSIQMKAISSVPENALSGKFSVSNSKKVYFAKGNLQYQASTRTWRFAEHQWDYIGDDNKNISSSYSGWIDLFGWGTGNSPTKNSIDESDYATFSDWGENVGDGWRTLTADEWKYIFDERITSSGIRYAKATVNGVCGVILLPDDWSKTSYNLSKTNTPDANYNSNSISSATWKSKFAPVGSVFLPAAGYRPVTSVYGVGSYGDYWSASASDSRNAYEVRFYSDHNDGLIPSLSYKRFTGHSVRLVAPAE